MESSLERDELVVQNMPNSVLEKGSHKLVFFSIATVGFLLIILGVVCIAYIPKHFWVPEVCIPLGVAIMAPAILSYLYRRYLIEDIKKELGEPARKFKEKAIEMLYEALGNVISKYDSEIAILKSAREAGLFGVYPSRREAIKAFLSFIEEENHEILIVGTSLVGLLQRTEKEFEDARSVLLKRKKAGVKIRFLMNHPKIAGLRGLQENRTITAVGNDILKSLRILREHWDVNPEDIKLYEGVPTHFSIKTEKVMLLNFYPLTTMAYPFPSLIVQKDGYFYKHFDFDYSHASIDSMVLPVPNDLNQLEGKLDMFTNKIQELMELTRS